MLYVRVTTGTLGPSYSSCVTESSHVGTVAVSMSLLLDLTVLLITRLPEIIAVTFCCFLNIALLVEQFL